MKLRPLPPSAMRPEYRDNLFSVFSTTFDDFFNTNFPEFSPVCVDVSYPKFNAYRKDGKLFIDIMMPFVRREDLEMEAIDTDNALHISVQNHQDKTVEEKAYYVKQIPRSSWRQTFTVDKNFPVTEAKADLLDGILRIAIPSHLNPESRKGRRVIIG